MYVTYANIGPWGDTFALYNERKFHIVLEAEKSKVKVPTSGKGLLAAHKVAEGQREGQRKSKRNQTHLYLTPLITESIHS